MLQLKKIYLFIYIITGKYLFLNKYICHCCVLLNGFTVTGYNSCRNYIIFSRYTAEKTFSCWAIEKFRMCYALLFNDRYWPQPNHKYQYLWHYKNPEIKTSKIWKIKY